MNVPAKNSYNRNAFWWRGGTFSAYRHRVCQEVNHEKNGYVYTCSRKPRVLVHNYAFLLPSSIFCLSRLPFQQGRRCNHFLLSTSFVSSISFALSENDRRKFFGRRQWYVSSSGSVRRRGQTRFLLYGSSYELDVGYTISNMFFVIQYCIERWPGPKKDTHGFDGDTNIIQ